MLINSIARYRLGYLALECIGKPWATTDCNVILSCSEIQCKSPKTAKSVMQYCKVHVMFGIATFK